MATNASQYTIAGTDKLSTHTAHTIGAPTAWRTTLHQTQLHGYIHCYDLAGKKEPIYEHSI
jgi:hypothetical protein